MTWARSLLLPFVLVTLATGSLACARGAGAQIVVTGPATPTARSLTSWFAHHIPARFEARGRFEVHPLSDDEMEAYLRAGEADSDQDQGNQDQGDQDQSSHADDGQIDGVFEDNPARITLRIPVSGRPDLFTFAHEYGHYVWFNLLSRNDRGRYEDLYQKQKARRQLVTPYAQTDAVEGFAEAFSFYVNDPALLLRRDPLSYRFLRQWHRPPARALTPTARAARPAEAEAVLETLCAAFGLNAEAARPIFYADPYYDLTHKRVLVTPPSTAGASLVSCLTVVPSLLRVGGVPVPAGGVAGVATRPECRRRGHAAALLEATVPALWDELGYPLSLLHPLSAPFYRRFGWETASRALRWSAVPSSLPRHPEAARVRPAAPPDWPALQEIQADLTRADTGASVRDARRWRLIGLPVPGRQAFVYCEGGAVLGYAIWERRETLFLLEMQGRTPPARRGLVGHLARQPQPTVEWPASPELLGRFGLPAGGPSEPGVMLRIVDLAAALAAVHPALYAPALSEAGGTLTIRATDTGRPANARPLRLTPDGVVPGTAHDPAWLRADIRILAQLYLGYRLPSEAAVSGLVVCDSPQTLALADRLFPARRPYVAPLDQV